MSKAAVTVNDGVYREVIQSRRMEEMSLNIWYDHLGGKVEKKERCSRTSLGKLFSVTGQIVAILGLMSHTVCVTTFQLCC